MRTDGDQGAARTAQDSCQLQRDGTDMYGCAQVVPGDEDRLALHCARKTDAERIRRVIQRRLPGRAFERNPVRRILPKAGGKSGLRSDFIERAVRRLL